MSYRVAVVGATGAVGHEMLEVLWQRRFPVREIVALASARSAGKSVRFGDRELPVEVLGRDSFRGVQVALFSPGASVSREFAPLAAQAGAKVVDNTSAFRMDPDVPLVVPEVNGDEALACPRGIIANPNCSTIQMVVALDPLRKAAGLRRIVVSTYQAVAGAGQKAMEELQQQMTAWASGATQPAPKVFPHPILMECIPQIGDFLPDGDSVEEQKMVKETQKIFGLPNLRVSATTVRVPVLIGHSESVNVELERPLSAAEARALLAEAPGVTLIDDPAARKYPLARLAAGTDPVYVGRVRRDPSVEHGLNLWVVSDNLRKGAALNAVQIAEHLAAAGAL
ncbi:MAG: aspartate-semialdehyde dehydrogenase [Deltaproteobacteria bacterium]|nr:aspartate-semialdehyde dehydrogenase [Deltaproteobacteria bacterium]